MARFRISVRGLLATSLAAFAAWAGAQTDAGDKWALCAPGPLIPERPAFSAADDDPETVDIEADRADREEGQRTVLRGDVQVEHQTKYLEADTVIYDAPAQRFDAEGDVRLWDDGVHLTGTKGRLELETDEVTIDNAGYILGDKHAWGEADTLILSESELVRARTAFYTTCDPDDADWKIHASSVRLDQAVGVGRAWNARVWLKGVPIFYSPFLQFPLTNERKTGFLTPSAGVSEERGAEATIPFYWNIAPNMDATFALRPMTERGVMGSGEFRYLTETSAGLIAGEYLPEDLETNNDRGALTFRHETRYRRWRADIDVNHVSDDDYLEDLGTDLSISSTRFLERRGDLRYSGNGWWTRLRLQDFQSIDETIAESAEPHGRLPQLEFRTNLPERNRRPNLALDAEIVNFHRDQGPRGLRVDLKPTLSLPWRTAWWYAVPSASLRHTNYSLEDVNPGQDDDVERTLPILSFDAGTFFERDLRFGGNDYIHTLEPRVFYLYVPFESQDEIPRFDTGQFTFSFSQLFRDNRFSGADRQGDANRVSVALTSRLLTPRGDELLRASIGQIRFLRDRDVGLTPGEPADTSLDSPIVAEAAANAGPWRFLGGLQWDPGKSRIERGTATVRYQPDPGRVVNAGYRLVRERADMIEQTDASFRWPLDPNWSVVGRWNYSLEEKLTLEAFGGVEYNSCCWAFRVVGRRFVNDEDADPTNALFLQLELKGLAGVGEAGEFLERQIPGYRNEF